LKFFDLIYILKDKTTDKIESTKTGKLPFRSPFTTMASFLAMIQNNVILGP